MQCSKKYFISFNSYIPENLVINSAKTCLQSATTPQLNPVPHLCQDHGLTDKNYYVVKTPDAQVLDILKLSLIF